MPNIAIVWDFDGTLTPIDSTTKVVEILQGAQSGGQFWAYVKSLKGDKKQPKWQHVLASDAPIWMYALSRIAFKKNVPLNREFFEQFVVPSISLFAHVPSFLRKLKLLEETQPFKKADLKINYFIISAGLKDLVELMLPNDLIKWTFGCRYEIIAFEGNEKEPESVPVFCMDETMKTRSLFEISKGSFEDKNNSVNKRVLKDDRWAPFENMVYIGDGDTDVPALSLVRSQGGMGVVVFDPNKPRDEVDKRLKEMRLNKRADLITPANFSANSQLFEYLTHRCEQICYRYLAEQSV